MLERRPDVRSSGHVNRDKRLAHERVNVRVGNQLASEAGLRSFQPLDSARLARSVHACSTRGPQQLLRRNAEGGLRAARHALFDNTSDVRAVAMRALVSTGGPVEKMLAQASDGTEDPY